ncbi:hypothetical protein K788_0005018 (plasmid) [Paraburkholderia caribensis MBA4]|uniref:Uncharacterized protein n=1 Tax=Paraburkholderia caribensis MBA4 TaxID=1323664 RepID=A0A0P0RKY1_9BURK|nr:hypothetical protein K788_0005018 [Paraburkholderia caribensis MBA4]
MLPGLIKFKRDFRNLCGADDRLASTVPRPEQRLIACLRNQICPPFRPSSAGTTCMASFCQIAP